MGRKNYFDVLKLYSDAKDTDIKKAIEELEKNINNNKNQGKISDSEIQEQKRLLDEIKVWQSNKEEVKQEKDEFIKEKTELINSYFNELPNNYEAYKREIKSWHERYRLTESEIREIMSSNPSHRIIEVKVKDLTENLCDKKYESQYKKAIDEFSSTPELIKIWNWAKDVKDFYDFLSKVSGESKEEIKKKDTVEINKIISSHKDEMVNKSGGNAGKFNQSVKNIFSHMQSVFDEKKPNNRKLYDNSIEYYKLKDVFDAIKEQPKEMLKDDRFVKNMINKIQKYYEDYDIALSIYNKEAGLLKIGDPYEPPKVVITMRCSSCGTISQFKTRDEAKKGVCAGCSLPFYKKCPNCGELIPASSNMCPSCKLDLYELKKATKYFNSAKNALLRNDYDEAYSYLCLAENADPKMIELKKISDYSAIKNKINAFYADFKKYLTSLNSFIQAKQYMHAMEELERIKAKNENINLSSQIKVITETIEKAKKMMPSANVLNEATVQRCYEVLDIVSDYLPANELIRKVPIIPVENLEIGSLEKNLGANISFKPSKSMRVTYYVTRNEDHYPKTQADGKMLLSDSDKLVIEDDKIVSGKKYYYSVFCSREGVFSKPTTGIFSTYVDIEKVDSVVNGQKCSLTFSLPDNAIGVRIYRKDNAIPRGEKDSAATLLSSECQGVLDDTSVLYNHQYGYLLQTCYLENNQKIYSSGIGILVKIEKDPSDLNDVSIGKEGSIFKVKWEPKEKDSINSIYVFSINQDLIGKKLHQMLPIEEINSLTKSQKLFGTSKCCDGQLVFTVEGNFSYDIAVISSTDKKGIVTYLGKISSIEFVEVDLDKSEIKEGSKAYIKLKRLPQMLYAIHYIIADVNSTKNTITKEDISRHVSYFITAEEYKKEGLISVSHRLIAAGIFKVLVVGEFIINGKHIFSDTSISEISTKKKVELSYYIEWKKKGIFKKTYSAKLIIITNDDARDLVLVGRDNTAPISISDMNAQIITEIESINCITRESSGRYEFDIPESDCYSGKIFRLFSKQPMTKIVSSDYNSLKYPK